MDHFLFVTARMIGTFSVSVFDHKELFIILALNTTRVSAVLCLSRFCIVLSVVLICEPKLDFVDTNVRVTV